MADGLFPADWAPWLGWMVFAVALAIGEIAMLGIFLIWIAIAAAVTGAAAFVFPLALLPMPAQVVLFAGLCLLCTWGGRRWYRNNPVASDDPLLNDRAARLVGRQVTVADAIVGGEGRVRIDDGTWRARGPDAVPGTRLTVVAVDGTTLTVAPVAGPAQGVAVPPDA